MWRSGRGYSTSPFSFQTDHQTEAIYGLSIIAMSTHTSLPRASTQRLIAVTKNSLLETVAAHGRQKETTISRRALAKPINRIKRVKAT
jgi:hypothetical protein